MRIISLKPYRIVDRGDDASGIHVEIEALDAAGAAKWDAISPTARGDYLIPPGLMLSIVRRLEAIEDRKPTPKAGGSNGHKLAETIPVVPAARLPRVVKG